MLIEYLLAIPQIGYLRQNEAKTKFFIADSDDPQAFVGVPMLMTNQARKDWLSRKIETAMHELEAARKMPLAVAVKLLKSCILTKLHYAAEVSGLGIGEISVLE